MAKFTANEVLDAPGNYVKTHVTRQIACSGQPADYTEATTTLALADVALSSADITLADGDVSGRKYTVAAKSGVQIDASGTATHVVLVDDTNEKLLVGTTCDPLPVTAGAGNQVNFPAWADEYADPV